MPADTETTTAAPVEAVSAPPSPALFPTQGQLLSALSTVHQLCILVKDRQNASLQLHARIHQVFLRIINCVKHGTLSKDFQVSSFTSVLNHFRQVLEQHLRLKNIVLRLLASRRFLASLKKVHNELSMLISKWQLASPTSTTMNWKQQLAVNVHLDEKTLHATLRELLATTFVAKEYGSERRQLHILMELVCEFAPERERWEVHSPQLLESLKMTHKRISNFSGVHVRRVPRWFLPRSEVTCSDRHKMIGHGSFGSTLFRGDYFGVDVGSTGGHPVAVKYLWPLKDAYYTQVEHLFIQTLQMWWHINHPNVAQVRGACHVSRPPHIVRDFTAYGSLTSYIAAVQTHAKSPKATKSLQIETVMWELLYGAAKGLLYLHEQMKIVHGGLRCNNILVNKYGQPVIADYGMRALECEVGKHNMNIGTLKIDDSELVRWQAPECLADEHGQIAPHAPTCDAFSPPPSCTSTFSFASDVYAFGMCILEVITGAAPWSGLDVSEVRSLKKNLGVLPPRPKHMHSNVWSLVQKMCVADPRQRISLREVLTEIIGLGYFGYAHADSANEGTVDGESMKSVEITEILGSVRKITDKRVLSAVEMVYVEDQELQDFDFLETGLPSDIPDLVEEEVSPSFDATVSEEHSVSVDEPQVKAVITLVDETDEVDDVVPEQTPETAIERADTIGGNVDAADPTVAATEPATVSDPPAASAAIDNGKLSAHKSTSAPADNKSAPLSISAVPSVDVRDTAQEPADVAAPTQEAISAELQTSAGAKTGQEVKGDVEKERHSSAVEEIDAAESKNIWGKDASTLEDPINVRVNPVKVASEYHDALGSANDEDVAVEDVPKAPASKYPGSVQVFREIPKDKGPPSVVSTIEPEHEIESNDGPYFDARKSNSSNDHDENQPEAVDEAPLSRASEIRNRIKSNSRGGDRSSFLDNLLRATTLRSDEYVTARETSEPAVPLSTLKYLDMIEAIKAEDQPEVVLQALRMLRNGLRRDKRDVDWTEQGGIRALLQVISKGVSEKCTFVTLDILIEIAVQNVGDIEAMVDSDAVKILLSFIEHREASDELDLVASFLLEILANSDNAKNQLWECEGIKVVEGNGDIDRRLVQEVKSIMAKFKSRYECSLTARAILVVLLTCLFIAYLL